MHLDSLTYMYMDLHVLPSWKLLQNAPALQGYFLHSKMRWTLWYIRNRKTEEKIIQNSKTAKKFGQNRIQTTSSDNKTEKPLLFSTKTENQMLKNEKSANRSEHQNRKTEVVWHKNRKTDVKNSQKHKNRKSQCPPLKCFCLIWFYHRRNEVRDDSQDLKSTIHEKFG